MYFNRNKNCLRMRIENLVSANVVTNLYAATTSKVVGKAQTLAAMASELIADNAAILRKCDTLEQMKGEIASRTMALEGVTDKKKQNFLRSRMGRFGVISAATTEELLLLLSNAKLAGEGLTCYTYRRR